MIKLGTKNVPGGSKKKLTKTSNLFGDAENFPNNIIIFIIYV